MNKYEMLSIDDYVKTMIARHPDDKEWRAYWRGFERAAKNHEKWDKENPAPKGWCNGWSYNGPIEEDYDEVKGIMPVQNPIPLNAPCGECNTDTCEGCPYREELIKERII